MSQVGSSNEESRDLSRLQFIDQLDNFGVVTLPLPTRPVNVNRSAVVAKGLIDEVNQQLVGDDLAIAEHDTPAASVPEPVGQFRQFGIRDR